LSDRGRGETEAGVEGAVLMVQMINAESKLLCLWVMEGKRPLLFANLFIIFNSNKQHNIINKKSCIVNIII
jgi:hypothetical protein